jgi:RNA polymerase sigma factor (sigma-70 family)
LTFKAFGYILMDDSRKNLHLGMETQFRMINKPPLSRATKKFLSEDELLAGLRDHNEQAVSHLYQTYWPMILQMVKTNNGSAAEAQDLYQESILDFLEKVWSEKLVLTCKIGTFIYSICRNKWLYILKGKHRFVDIHEHIQLGDMPQEEADEMPLPDNSQILQAIAALGEPCRSLLIGFYYEKASMEQLAARFNYRSMQVAKQQKYRCKDRLKNSMLHWFNTFEK